MRQLLACEKAQQARAFLDQSRAGEREKEDLCAWQSSLGIMETKGTGVWFSLIVLTKGVDDCGKRAGYGYD